MIPDRLRQFAAHWRAVADAAWTLFQTALSEGRPDLELCYASSVANTATRLAHDYERKAVALENAPLT